MTSGLAAFDDWLNGVLAERAREADEDIDTYVTRAVASRLLTDQMQADGSSVEQLLKHLSESGVLRAATLPIPAIVTDPERLRALHATGLLDSPPEELYDRITRAAAAALNAPSAAVSLIDADRQFFKSTFGMAVTTPEERETPLERSICTYTVANGMSLILEDARTDPTFKNHPVVVDGMVVAYLGIPLTDHEGNAVGALCVFDDKPRRWGTGHVQTLTDLAQLTAERIFGAGTGSPQ